MSAMNFFRWFAWNLAFALVALAQPVGVDLRSSPDGTRVDVRLSGNNQSPKPLEFRVMRSDDLRSWSPTGRKVRLGVGTNTVDILLLEDLSSRGFYRVSSRETSFSAAGGSEVLGYQSSFDDQIDALGNFTVQDFAAKFSPEATYLPFISWDPTNSLYWDAFQRDLPKTNSSFGLPVGGSTKVSTILPGFRLSDKELAIFRTNGFVVSERLAQSSFGEVYYDIFERDLPVFVTTDSILHAWYRSFSAILEVVEEGSLRNRLRNLLRAMLNSLGQVVGERGYGAPSHVLSESTEDSAYLLGVAVRLCSLPGEAIPEVWPVVADPYDPEGELQHRIRRDRVARRIAETLDLIQAAKPSSYQFFKARQTGEMVDFSQFIPRGHYAKFPALQRYFQAMMWLGRVDLRVAGNSNDASNRQLGAAIVLNDLLERSGRRETWDGLDTFIRNFFGPADSMDFRQLDALLKAEGLTNLVELASWDRIERLRQKIDDGTLGAQAVLGHGPVAGAGDDQMRWPRSFTFLGQRFSVDNWALGQTVMDRIVEPGSNPNRLVRRRRPYALDVAFAALANNQVVLELVANMTRSDGEPFRDGFPYQRNLAAARMTLDARPAGAWTSTLYDRWLHALRSLSDPTTSPEYPEAMRTKAWAMKTVNTQLASWTQLRNSSVLYVKPSVTPEILCEYPAGFVEPVPVFFQEMGALASMTAELLDTLLLSRQFTLERGEMTLPNPSDFFREFSRTCGVLESIARKELDRKPLLESETNFLKDTIEHSMDTYTGQKKYTGWYTRLFFWGSNENGTPSGTEWIPGKPLPIGHDCAFEALSVTDVHTDGPSAPDSDPGGVLHEGIGRVNVLMIAVDNGLDRMVFAGPVFTHHEFTEPIGVRLTDDDWRKRVKSATPPKPPPWTRHFLIPDVPKP